MCTYVVQQKAISGSGKGVDGWFQLSEVNVSYDHPFHVPLEHAVNIDFTNYAQGPAARVAVELTPDAARALVAAVLEALERGEEAERMMGAATA